MKEDGGTGVGVVSVLAFLFLNYSRLTDFWLASLYLPLIASLVALTVTICTGGLRRALMSKVGFWLSAFSTWLVLAVPFSFWRGGSVDLLWNQWLDSFLVFVIVAGVLRSVRHCRAAMFAIAGGTVIIVVMCLVVGTTSEQGRLVLAQGVLANPNDLADLLLMGLPFLMLIAMSKGRALVKRPGAAACIVVVLLVTAGTGSRGALIAVACLISVMFLEFSWGSKVKMLGAIMVVAVLVLPFVSADQRQRYMTMFSEPSARVDRKELSARESTTQRLYLLKQSLDMTMSHPLFGVGPGVFSAAAARASNDVGEQPVWRETHNTYTQVSSEAGLPALVFYIAALMACLKIARSIYKAAAARDDLNGVANMSYCLWLSLISFAVTSFFSSVAYHTYLPTLAGLTVALQKCTKLQLEALQAGGTSTATLTESRMPRVLPGRASSRPAQPI